MTTRGSGVSFLLCSSKLNDNASFFSSEQKKKIFREVCRGRDEGGGEISKIVIKGRYKKRDEFEDEPFKTT